MRTKKTSCAAWILMTLILALQVDAQVRRQVGSMGPSYKSVKLKTDLLEIPFEIASTAILVDDVFVNGEGPFRFQLDTGGMGGGRIDESVMKKLGLEAEDSVQAGDSTDRPTRSMPVLTVDSLTFHGMEVEGVRVLSRDYNSEMAIDRRGRIDGILGFGLFKDYLLKVDYANKTLTIETGDLPDADGKSILQIDNEGVPGVEIKINGEKHRAHFDTGSMGPVSIPESLAETLNFKDEPRVVGEARTLTGSFPIKIGQLDGQVTIGEHILDSPSLMIGGPLQSVNVGGQVLREFVVTYDQKNDRIRIEKPTSSDK